MQIVGFVIRNVAAFAMAILDLISRVQLASFVVMQLAPD